jgi:hypothetical protein
MADAVLSVLIQAKDEATKVLGQVNNAVGDMSKQFKMAGVAMLGAGASIVAGLTMAVKAAAEEDAGIQKLRQTMANLGLSYDDCKDSLEAWIDAEQQKTTVSDTEQRESLSKLLVMTGNLAKSQELLSLAMDMAVGTGRDLSSTVDTLGYALAGNWGMVNRMIPALANVSTEEEKWAFLREKFVGQAAAYSQTLAGQFTLLKNNLGDLKEAIGETLVGAVTPLVENANKLIQHLKDLDPALKQWITTTGLVVGAIGLLSGGLFVLLGYLPKVIEGYKALVEWSGAAAVATNKFYLALVPIAGLAYIAADGIGTLTGNTQRYGTALDNIMIGVNNWKRLLGGSGDEAVKTGDKTDELRRDLEALGFTGQELTDTFNTLANAGYIGLGTLTADGVHKLTDKLNALNAAAKETQASVSALNAEIDASKVALATAQWTIEGTTYRQSLFTQAEIEAAQGAGKKVTMLRTQEDELWDNVQATIAAQKEAYKLADAENAVAKSTNNANTALGGSTEPYGGGSYSPTGMAGVGASWEYAEWMRLTQAGEITEDFLTWLKHLTKEIPLASFQHGGIMPYTGLAHLEKGETVLPSNTILVANIYLNSKLISREVIHDLTREAKLQGAY